MKNLLTIGILLLLSGTLFAQVRSEASKIPAYPRIKPMPQLNATPLAKRSFPFMQNAPANDTSYWVSYAEAVDSQYMSGALSLLPLWPDSLGYVTVDETSGFHWYIHGFASVLDPASYFIGEYVGAENWFSLYQSYKLDSLAFGYTYDRNVETYNGDSIVDTLMIYIIDPDTLRYATIPNNPQQGDTPIVTLIPYIDTLNSPPPGAVIRKDTVLLTQDDAVSSSTGNFDLIVIALDSAVETRPGQLLAVAFQYLPGKPYSLGDTIIDQRPPPAEVANPQNLFRLVTYEENPEQFPLAVFDDESFNYGGVAHIAVRYPESNFSWNGYYLSNLAFSAGYRYEHAYMFWHVKPKGASFTTSKSNCKTAQLTDVSNFGPTEWTWIYDNDSTTIKTGSSVTYEFPGSGVYNVCLYAKNDSVDYVYCEELKIFCASIGEGNDFDLELYPIPARDHLMVSAAEAGGQDFLITIIDLQGREIYSETIKSSNGLKKVVDVKAFPDGLYTVKVQSEKGFAVKKVLVQ